MQSASSNSSSSSTTTRVRAREGAAENMDVCLGIDPHDREILEDAYMDNIGQRMPPVVCRTLMCDYAAGMQTDVMLAAIEATGLAPRPSAPYLLAILRRYMADGVLTGADLLRDEQCHEEWRAREADRRWRLEPR